MYKEFFNFSAEPFRVTPDPGFLYLTDQHKEALAAIIYGIAKRKGFVCITGEVGVGKTTILRSYLDSVDEPGLTFVYVYNPNVSFQTLLRHIFKEIGLDYPGDDIAGMVDALRAWLIAHHDRRKTLVLLVDEAQNMPIGTLESLRMLSNLETATEKLVQIVLVGQPELEALLAERQLRQLESRIAVRTRLGPLSRADSANYIRHRLKCVALDEKPAFTDTAITEIVRVCGGIPRRINVVADNVLLTAFGHKIRPVTPKVVREVVRDLNLKEPGTKGRRRRWFAVGVPWRGIGMGLGAVAAAGLVLTGGIALRDGIPPSSPPSPLVSAPLPPAPAKTAKVEAPLPLHLKSEPVPAPPPASAEPVPELTNAALPPLPPAIPVDLAPVANLPGTTPAKAEERRRTLRIVAPGDTLAGLAFQVYGRVDRPLLEAVKQHNPEIINIDRIQVGQLIEFPDTAN
ncbi:MAG: AAA family ATPase [Magnetospirillum sp.]|nr:AAA family ATPase [Magnetospirillum sp.]